MSTPTQEQIVQAQETARKALAEKQQLTALSNQARAAGTVSEAAKELGSFLNATGMFAIASAFIHSWIYSNPTLNFDNGKKVVFKADVWGVGLGGGAVWLAGNMASPEELIGEVSFAFQTNPVHTEIAFWKNGAVVGVLVGGGLSIQVGAFGGTGTFSWA
ncbi:hypothetical protein [Chitinimonas koreensis]|uniref:hypothetical protein n=1 Tax=Chitinimonas koreensis TaxID=356302 RepID=UPI000422489E|nr:hypothetical protein [Chitinimonas koreensis]QNM96010.1 hypothetical protein H9L41_19660 [Chitinimonas koreensis]